MSPVKPAGKMSVTSPFSCLSVQQIQLHDSYVDLRQVGIILLMVHTGAKMISHQGIWRGFVFLWGGTGDDTQKICMKREVLDACGSLNNLHHPWTDSLGKCA